MRALLTLVLAATLAGKWQALHLTGPACSQTATDRKAGNACDWADGWLRPSRYLTT